VAAGVAHGGGYCSGVGGEVGPGAVEQLTWDHGVAIAVDEERACVLEPVWNGGDAGVEGECAVEDGCACVAGWVVEQQSAGECGAATETDEHHRSAAGRSVVEPCMEPVRRLFIDRLTPDQLDAIATAAETVLAYIDS
jgi:hypothetical protein